MMECASAAAPPATAALTVSPASLLAAFATVLDPRRRARSATPCQSTLHRVFAARCGEHLADAARLLALKRGHRRIENRPHRTKDVTLGEDRSLVHVGAGPTVMALLRDTALGLLHRSGHRAVASRLRAHAEHPATALALVLGQPPTHA